MNTVPRRIAITARVTHSRRWLAIIVIAVGFLGVPPFLDLPGRSVGGCAGWIGLAVLFELLSVLGFTIVFKLVFGARMSRRQGVIAGLRAIGASTVLPAGGLVGPVIGARSANADEASIASLTRSTVAFTVITNLPGVLVLGILGLTLWLGWPTGTHDPALTLLAAGMAFGVLGAGLVIRGSFAADHQAGNERPVRSGGRIGAGIGAVRGGFREADRLLSAGNWRLAGAVGYYAFDNAVLWAAFRAHGSAPPLSVIVMGYLVGSLGTALPLPAGIGAVEGGLIGALVLYGARLAPTAGAVLLYRGVSLLLPVLISALAWALLPEPRLRAEPWPAEGPGDEPGAGEAVGLI